MGRTPWNKNFSVTRFVFEEDLHEFLIATLDESLDDEVFEILSGQSLRHREEAGEIEIRHRAEKSHELSTVFRIEFSDINVGPPEIDAAGLPFWSSVLCRLRIGLHGESKRLLGESKFSGDGAVGVSRGEGARQDLVSV